MVLVATKVVGKTDVWGTHTQLTETPVLTLWPGTTSSTCPSKTTSAPTTSRRRRSTRSNWTPCPSCFPEPACQASYLQDPWSTLWAKLPSSSPTTSSPCWQTRTPTRRTSNGVNTILFRATKVCQVHVTFARWLQLHCFWPDELYSFAQAVHSPEWSKPKTYPDMATWFNGGSGCRFESLMIASSFLMERSWDGVNPRWRKRKKKDQLKKGS